MNMVNVDPKDTNEEIKGLVGQVVHVYVRNKDMNLLVGSTTDLTFTVENKRQIEVHQRGQNCRPHCGTGDKRTSYPLDDRMGIGRVDQVFVF